MGGTVTPPTSIHQSCHYRKRRPVALWLWAVAYWCCCYSLLMAAPCMVHGFTASPSFSVLSLSPRRERHHPLEALTMMQMKQNNDKHSSDNNDEETTPSSSLAGGQSLFGRFRPWRKAATLRLRKWAVVPVTLGVLSSIPPMSIARFRPKAAWAASAPVMVPTRQEHIDPETEAMFDNNKRIEQENAREHQAFQLEARKIGNTKGEQARREFEQSWEAQRQQKAAAKQRGLVELKQRLLSEGLDPSCDPEANRQIVEYEKGIDLAQVPGTKYYMEKDFEKNQPKRSMKYQKAPNRFIIKCMVEDMKKKGRDPLQYFETHQDQTADILNMSFQKATLLAQQYKANLEQYGQLTVPKEGETSTPIDQEVDEATQKQQTKDAAAKARAEKRAEKQKQKEERQKQKKEAKQRKAEEKAQAKRLKEEERENKELRVKAAALAGASAVVDTAAKGVDAVTGTRIFEEKQEELAPTPPPLTRKQKKQQEKEAKAEAKRQKEEAKALEKRNAAKQGAAATAAGAAAAGVAGTAGMAAGVDVESTAGTDALTESNAQEMEGATSPGAATTNVAKSEKKGLPVGKAAGAVVTVGGGAFAIKFLKEKADRDEEERQRRYKLLMGQDAAEGTSPTEPRLDVDKTPQPEDKGDDMDLDDPDFFEEKATVETSISEPATKKRRGFKKMFGKKKSDRETDLTVLVSEGATAPEFALLLSKILTFGAPGRFPHVTTLPGDMPMAEFDLEAAKALLEEAAAEGEITKEQGAEIFANVVNCMLIDIVDLASSALKEDDKVLVNAINIVVDYMNHAASLYDSVAEGVVITPVTYGGDLGKAKLEQMYSKYAVSGMMSMDEDFNARVGLLQDVFSISEKKAEGLMMKAMQKNMMKMMKSGEGMEGMDEMMKAMGGDMAGMGGLPGMDGEDGPNPEQLKEMLLMLKTMKDSGSIPPDELEAVRAQFREAYGSGIEDVIAEADEEPDAMDESDRELLELMKDILRD